MDKVLYLKGKLITFVVDIDRRIKTTSGQSTYKLDSVLDHFAVTILGFRTIQHIQESKCEHSVVASKLGVVLNQFADIIVSAMKCEHGVVASKLGVVLNQFADIIVSAMR